MGYGALKQRLGDGGVVVLDGGTGTELQKRGADMDPSAWCGPATLHNERLLTEIHRDYIRAGADVITANSYASSRLMLEPAGFGDRVEEINRRAVEAALAAREGVGMQRNILVAGSLSHMVPVSPGTDRVDPAVLPSTTQVFDAFRELAEILKESGVDLILLESMYQPARIRMALEAALATELPVWFGCSARKTPDGRIIGFDYLEETPLDSIFSLIPDEGVDVAGCMHTGSELVAGVLQTARKHFSGPLMAYPDSGYFEMPDWQFVDVITPARLEAFYRQWIADGVQVIGGCCGLGVQHIEAAARARDTAAHKE